MLKRYGYLLLVVLAIAVVGCAKRGNITGGAKDTLSPVLVSSLPKNFSTNFKGNIIRLNFDEYIKLKDVNKQLVISPPLNYNPEVSPTSSSKFITIKIKDTLQPNTTYSFNFGQSIQDNNEANPYPQFKYVFSTGTYIDSLSIEGSIKDALETATDNFVNVMLYEKNEAYNDSVIYKQKPRYVTNTLDSLKTFKIENIKAGEYLLVAVKDNNNNYKFDPAKDRIAFHSQTVTIPTTEKFELELFSETLPFKALKPVQVSGNRLTMGYEGEPKNIKTIVKSGNDIFPSIVTKFPEKDSVNIWFKPVKADSISVSVTRDSFLKDFMVKLKNQKVDTLSISPLQSGTLELRDTFTLNSNTPLVQFDKAKMSLRNKDSVAVEFTTEYDEFLQKLKFNFKKEPLEKYSLQLLPGALIDFYEKANDTLSYTLSTKNSTEYGLMTLHLQNVKRFPIIVQLVDDKGKILAEEYSKDSPTIIFQGLEPSKFTLRIIYDDNQNGVWDAGNFLEKRQSEEVIYFPKPLDVRANWDVIQEFDLGD